MATLVSTGQVTIMDLNDGLSIVLSNSSHLVPADASGAVSSFSGASTTVKVMQGATDVTSSWVISKVDTACTSTLATATVTVSALSADVGYVDITAIRSGWPSLTARFTVAKAKQGVVGLTGADASTYWMQRSTATIKVNGGGGYSPGSVTFSGFRQTGAGAPAAYACRFIIATSPDLTTWTDAYTSAADESSKSFTPAAGLKGIRCRMYLAGGVTAQVDEETVVMVADGIGTDLCDTTWWSPTAAFQWAKAEDVTGETSIVWGTGLKGQTAPLLRCLSDSINKCYQSNCSGGGTNFWFTHRMLTGTAETVFVVDTAKFNTTPSSYKLTKSSLATDAKGRASQAIPVVAGQVLRISIAYSGDTATAAGINVVVNEAAVAPASGAVNDANRTRVTTLVNNGACTTGWTVFNTTTYTVPAGITAISLAIWSGVNGPVNLSFDDPYVSLASNTYSVSGPRTGADGGYDGTALNEIPIDSAKSYRFIVPVRINNGSRASQVYFGPQNAGKCCTINTSTVFVNPYFCNASTVALTDGAWYLMVGYIYPAGSTGTTSNDAGIYDCSTGQKVVSGASFCFAAGVTSIGHRAYQYYADIGSLVEFGAPMVHCVDGSEPQLRTWMRSTSSDIVVGAVGNSGLFNSAITRSVSSGQVAYQSGSIGTFVKADVNRNTLITGNCEVVIGLAVPSVSFPVGNYFISIGGDILSNGAVIGSYYYQSTFSNIAPISGTTGNSLTINIPIYITYPAPLAALPAGNCVLTAAISASIYTSIGYTAGTAPVAMVACTSTYRVHVTELIV